MQRLEANFFFLFYFLKVTQACDEYMISLLIRFNQLIRFDIIQAGIIATVSSYFLIQILFDNFIALKSANSKFIKPVKIGVSHVIY